MRRPSPAAESAKCFWNILSAATNTQCARIWPVRWVLVHSCEYEKVFVKLINNDNWLRCTVTIWDVCKSTSTLNIEIFAATHLVTLPQHTLPIRAVIEPGISSDEKLYQPALLFAQTALLLNSIQTIICHSVNHLTFDSNHTTEPEFLQGGNGSQCATVNLGLGNVEAWRIA